MGGKERETSLAALRTGNSLSAMWDDIISRFSAGDISMIDVTRRAAEGNPVPKILLQLIRSSNA